MVSNPKNLVLISRAAMILIAPIARVRGVNRQAFRTRTKTGIRIRFRSNSMVKVLPEVPAATLIAPIVRVRIVIVPIASMRVVIVPIVRVRAVNR